MSDGASKTELPAIGFAEDLSQEERQSMGSFGEFITVTEGDVLITEGKEQDALFLVVFGNFHVQTETTGRVVLLGRLKSGDTMGEMNIFDPGEASASVVAKTLSQVWRIDRQNLENFLESHPKTASRVLVNIATQLSKRLRRTNEKVALAREAMLDSF